MELTAFTEFGQFAFTGGEPLSRRIYDALWANLGDNYARDGYTDAKVYALAMAMARLLTTQERLDAQIDPATVLELLADREREYGLTVAASATLTERRTALTLAMLAGRAGTRGNLLQTLTDRVGTAFVDCTPTATGDVVLYPSSPASGPGNHIAPGSPKRVLKLTENHSVMGAVQIGVSHLDDSVPSATEAPQVGEYVVIQPDVKVLRERCEVTAVGLVSGVYTLTVTLTKAHPAGAHVVSGRWPYWASSRRYSAVELTPAGAADATTHRLADETMARMARAVSTWAVTNGTGPFVLDESDLDVTPF